MKCEICGDTDYLIKYRIVGEIRVFCKYCDDDR